MNKKKILLWSGALLAILGLAYGVYRWMQPQSIVLEDGTRITLLGVTYGEKHVSPIPWVMPKTVRSAHVTTSNDTLYAWFYVQSKTRNTPYFEVFAYDQEKSACVASQGRNYGNGRAANAVIGFNFAAFPRHGSKIIFRLMQWGRNGQEDIPGQFAISNPDRERVSSSWPIQSLPDKQSDGDLDVTLDRVGYDDNAFFYGNNSEAGKSDLRNRGVVTQFRIEQNGEVATNWQAVQVETSDASGNHVKNNNSSIQRENGEPVFVYQWGLWPDEPAWKLHMEFSRTSGFDPGEVWSVNEIPIEKGNVNTRWQRDPKAASVAEATFGNSVVKLMSVKKFPANQVQGWGLDSELVLVAAPDLDGYRITILKLTDEQGHEIPSFNYGQSAGQYHYGLRGLGDAKTVNAVIAIHRSRFFDFTIKPPKL